MLLNLMYSSLSREMEFNADKVAVSVSGSDAILSALWKLDFGFEKWNNTLNNAYLAAQKKLFTDNLYFHNSIAIVNGEEKIQSALRALEAHPKGGKYFFKSTENSRAQMYASHPTNDKRQENAKSPYIEGETDRRSPWKLFQNKEQLQKEMTQLIYEKYLDKKEISQFSRESFQDFVNIEEAMSGELEEAFEKTFENRLFEVPESKFLTDGHLDTSTFGTIESLQAEVKELMRPVNELNVLIEKAEKIGQRVIKEKSLIYEGKKYTRKNLNEGYEKMINAQNKLLFETFLDWDKQFCLIHLQLCPAGSKREELRNRYQQHRVIVDIFKKVLQSKERIYKDLHQLQANPELTEMQVVDFSREVQLRMMQINDPMEAIDTMQFVSLPNIESTDVLKNAIIEGGEFKEEPGKIFENGGFDRILQRLEQTIGHLNRIHAKSMHEILVLQHSFVKGKADI